ncbi:MAG: hypothetical protein LBL26_09985, partial [Peptococcaceae bacterium]|nr:hypothetical protein [Peptococcaceae bacterium]
LQTFVFLCSKVFHKSVRSVKEGSGRENIPGLHLQFHNEIPRVKHHEYIFDGFSITNTPIIFSAGSTS